MSPPSSQESYARALEFERATLSLVVDEVRRIDEGWVIRASDFPDVWALNNVWIDREVSYAEAERLCQRHLPESHFDQLFIQDERLGERLAETFRARGWKIDVHAHSVLARGPDRRVPTDAVVEAEEGEALDLMERWLKEDPTLVLTESELHELREGNGLTWRARNARRLGARDENGRLIAMTMLYSDGAVAQVEDVYVVPEARGRGYGRMLVTRAIDLARQGGHELTFIVADDADWPKQLYRKLGFDPVGRSWVLHRARPAAA